MICWMCLVGASLVSSAWAAEQTFCRPTRDSVFKHVLNDSVTRKSFIRALSPFKNVISSDLMNSELRPLAVDKNLLNILKKPDFQTFVMNPQHLELSSALFGSVSGQTKDAPKLFPFLQSALKSEPKATKAELQALRKEYEELSLCQNFFAALRKKFDLILLALLDEKKGVCDIVSRLDTGDIVLVEAQVEKKDCLDKRFLAYATSLYSNQIREGEEWSKLKNVASVILISHDVSNSLGWSKNEFKRHYLLTDQVAVDEARRNKWPYLQIILYCLPKVDLGKTDDPLQRSWLEFFMRADKMDEIPQDTPLEVVAAYERARRRNLPLEVLLSIKDEDAHLKNMAGVFQDIKRKGERKGERRLLRKLLENHSISNEQYEATLQELDAARDEESEDEQQRDEIVDEADESVTKTE